jgi:hypothetical protein
MTKIPINVSRSLKYDPKQLTFIGIFVILTTFCLESFFKGLITFISILVILTTFCLGSYFKDLLTFIGIFVILTTFC